MSDTKKDQNEDIVASAEDAPEIIGDQNLEDAAGGWSWGGSLSTSNVAMSGGTTMVNTNINLNTADGSTVEDTLQTTDTSFLRTRPGRVGNW